MIGLFINTLSINLFYIPNNVVSTGSTGLAILVNNFIDIPIPLIVFVISSILLLIGFMVLEWNMVLRRYLGQYCFLCFWKELVLLIILFLLIILLCFF